MRVKLNQQSVLFDHKSKTFRSFAAGSVVEATSAVWVARWIRTGKAVAVDGDAGEPAQASTTAPTHAADDDGA